MQIIRCCLGVVSGLPHVKEITVDVVLQDELGRVKPALPVSMTHPRFTEAATPTSNQRSDSP